MIATPQPAPMSVDQYLAWEPQQETRYEYINGKIYAMTGGTIPHNDIAINLLTTLLPQVRDQGCRLNMADVKLQIDASSLYYYPDLIVSCDPRDLNAQKFIQFPKLIVEVLSPGTADKDRGDKFRDYQQIPTLQEYLLISSEKVSAECYRRGKGRMWLYYPYSSGDQVNLESLGFNIAIEQLYTGVNFDAPTQANPLPGDVAMTPLSLDDTGKIESPSEVCQHETASVIDTSPLGTLETLIDDLRKERIESQLS